MNKIIIPVCSSAAVEDCKCAVPQHHVWCYTIMDAFAAELLWQLLTSSHVLESSPQKCDMVYFGGLVPVIQRKLLSPSFTMLYHVPL